MLKVVVILGFLVAFAAGFRVAVETRTVATTTPPPSTRPATTQRSGFLRAALNLTPDQQEKMKKIWEAGMPNPREQRERRDKCRSDRDVAIQALLTPEQKANFEQIQKDYRTNVDAIDQEAKAEFQRKVEETK